MSIQKISENDIARASMEGVANRPNDRTGFGNSGMTPQQLKERHSALPKLAIRKLNEVIEAFGNEESEGDLLSALYLALEDEHDMSKKMTLAAWIARTEQLLVKASPLDAGKILTADEKGRAVWRDPTDIAYKDHFFTIVRSFESVDKMNASYPTDDVPVGALVIIDTGSTEDEDTGKIYYKGLSGYVYRADLSGPKGKTGEQGGIGPDGLSAYGVALKKGFEGTEEEWLASLKAAGPIRPGSGINAMEGGESIALGTESFAVGRQNLAGSKAFTVMSLDETANTYTLDSVEGLDVGDVYSLRLACYNADTGVSDAPQKCNIGAITAINAATNTVTVDTMFKPSDVGEGFAFRCVTDFADENGIDYETNAFRIIAKPFVGTRTIGSSTIALGNSNQSLSKNAFSEGCGNIAYGSHSHAEGYGTEASYAAHSEGKNTVASGFSAHSEGENTVSSGNMSHAEGRNTEAKAHFSHTEGYYTEATGNQAHAEGNGTHATNYSAHAEGDNTTASGDSAHAEGVSTKATAKDAHAEGNATEATAVHAHAEGQRSKAQHNSAHAEGFETISAGDASHSEGYQTKASDKNRHRGAHAEGVETKATGSYYDNTYIGAHAEGYKAEATAVAAHAEGKQTVASGKFAHAEGNGTKSTNNSTHAEGWSTTASGENAHAEGAQTVASGNNSHAGGKGTKATVEGQYAVGLYNAEDPDAYFLVGNGSSTKPSNAFGVCKDGTAYIGAGPKKPKDVATKEFVESEVGKVSYKLTDADKAEIADAVEENMADAVGIVTDYRTVHTFYGDTGNQLGQVYLNLSAEKNNMTNSFRVFGTARFKNISSENIFVVVPWNVLYGILSAANAGGRDISNIGKVGGRWWGNTQESGPIGFGTFISPEGDGLVFHRFYNDNWNHGGWPLTYLHDVMVDNIVYFDVIGKFTPVQ